MKDKESLAAVPIKQLQPVLKELLKLEEAQSVSQLHGPLKQLSFEQLQLLWPEIVYRIEHRCSLNVMFEQMQVACLDLLAEHRVEEGLDLAAYLLFTQNGWGSGERNKKTLKAVLKYGAHAKRLLFPLKLYLTKNIGFINELQGYKQKIQALTEKPELRSIAPWLGERSIGDEFEKQIAMRELRKMTEKDSLADYWRAYEMCRTLLETKKDWASATQTVMNEILSLPEGADIIEAHLAIEKIKKSFKDKKITREQVIERLSQYKNWYDIKERGPNLVYWYSLIWRDNLIAGKGL